MDELLLVAMANADAGLCAKCEYYTEECRTMGCNLPEEEGQDEPRPVE